MNLSFLVQIWFFFIHETKRGIEKYRKYKNNVLKKHIVKKISINNTIYTCVQKFTHTSY